MTSVEAWATMPLPDLMQTIQNTTLSLALQIQTLAADEGAYQRKFWSRWQELSPELSVAAATRECERACKELDEQRTLSRAMVESMTVKRDSMLALLSARTPR